MNKHRYRLVFNRARGLMMAVAENIAVHNTAASPSPNASPIARQVLANITPLRLSLMLMLGSALAIINPAQADIIADPSAPAGQQPIIGNTANGLPLVNIQTPSAAGVSRNTYSQFDVNAQGAILNNSNANVQTQLGGWVQGNPLLAGGTARVILNEVNSSNPSLLNGFIEIAGSRAQLVIANPAGISCNGCGFINANRATLTTGTPILNGGHLLGYRVGGGSISFLGQGMDASQANYTDIIARAVEVNAGIWANALNITTGANQVDIDSNGKQTAVSHTAPASPAPAFAVDVAALGGMYAGKIHLIGTEAGLGVRNAGHIGASVGEVVVTAYGHIINAGNITAATDIALNAHAISNTNSSITAGADLSLNAASLGGDGILRAGGNASLNLTQDYHQTTDGLLEANGSITLSTNGNLINDSRIAAGGSLLLQITDLYNNKGAEITGENTTLSTAGSLLNRGTIDGGSTHISSAAIENIGTGAIFGDHLSLDANTVSNSSETMDGQTMAAVIAARERLDIATGALINQDGSLIFSSGDIAIGSTLDAGRQAQGTAGGITNTSATIEASGNMSIQAETLANQRRTFGYQRIQVGSSSNYHTECVDHDCDYVNHFRTYITEYEDQITSNSPLASITAGGDAAFNVGAIINLYSNIQAGGDMDITGNSLANQGAELFHQTDTTVSRNLIHWGDRDHGTWVTSSSASVLIDTIPAIISAGGTLTGTFTSRVDNLSIRENTAPLASSATPPSSAAEAVNIPSSSLFQPSPDATASYLIETAPQFASYRAWLSSDYMVQQLAFDPAITQKRLGDGFYEQRLVREQIAELTGKRFLEGYADDEAQYQALMSNGLTEANALQLIPGIALTAEQVAQLTSDIV